MFVFQDYAHINKTMIDFERLSEKEKKDWYKKYGIQTYGQLFSEVIKQEDSISTYYSSLPEEQQRYLLTQPQVFSEVYKRALKKGIIKVVKEEDNEYFDLNLVDKKYANFLNLEGKVIIGNDLLSIDECEEKVYPNAIVGSSTIDISRLKPAILKTNAESNQKLKTYDPYNWSKISKKKTFPIGQSFYYWNNKKVWAEIEGSSHLMLYFEEESSSCARSVYCIFDLKAYAQQKNFWGNYVFGNWSTNISFDATWEYEHASWNEDDPALHDQCLCGYDSWDITTGTNNFPAYSCSPNPAYMCPTSPYHETAVGNGCIRPITPEGIIPYSFGDGGFWWARPIIVYNADITITIYSYVFHFRW
jgi:hypothetical protein